MAEKCKSIKEEEGTHVGPPDYPGHLGKHELLDLGSAETQWGDREGIKNPTIILELKKQTEINSNNR